jgi:hypothetical protein
MANNFYKVKKGINVEPVTGSTVTAEGDLAYNDTSNQLEIYNGSAAESITTATNTQTFTNKTFDAEGSGNSLSNIVNANIKASAAIAYSKLNLSGSIVNADVSGSAAIARSKLASGTADHVLINNASGVMTSEATLAKSRGGTGADNSSVTFPASGTIVTRTATETLTNKTLTLPIISSISNTGTLTLPTSTDTLIGRDTTDTLTNKTISGSNNTITNVSLTTGITGVLDETNGGTGQSSFTTGDILYASGANTLSKLAVGANGQILKLAAGLPSWGNESAVATPTRQIFTSGTAQTYTRPTSPTPTYIKVTCIGGGGNGGGGSADANSGAGGGGGAGATAIKWINSPDATYTYTVGGAGATTSFGSSVCEAGGGSTGSNSVATAGGGGGAGGTAAFGDILIDGQPGDSGILTTSGVAFGSGGTGGSTSYGSGGRGYAPNAGGAGNGLAATGYGAGGGGGAGQNATGGAGTSGIIIVEEFYA